jgi:hypothetical protein
VIAIHVAIDRPLYLSFSSSSGMRLRGSSAFRRHTAFTRANPGPGALEGAGMVLSSLGYGRNTAKHLSELNR